MQLRENRLTILVVKLVVEHDSSLSMAGNMHTAWSDHIRAKLLASLSMCAFASVASATILTEPSVASQSPELMQYRVLVTGEVRTPGRATLTVSTMTVLDALEAAGSLTINAGDYVVVIHPAKPGETPERRTIDLKDLEQGTAGIDVALHDGDIVNVPLGERFYISGFVKAPGLYRLSAGTTVSQAIALAGGLADGGTDRRLKIGRVVKRKSVEIPAQLGDVVLPGNEIKVQRKMF